MPVTHVQVSCTRNLHVCHSDLQQDFSCAGFLHETEHVLFDVLVQENCIKNLISRTGNLYKFFVQVSSTCVRGIRVNVAGFSRFVHRVKCKGRKKRTGGRHGVVEVIIATF